MTILSATEVTVYSNISASAATITASGLIPIVQQRVLLLTNNYFNTGIGLLSTMTFYPSNNSVVADSSFADENLVAGDDVFILGSYRNNGVHTIASVTTVTMTLSSATTVVDELSGASIFVSLIQWPTFVKKVAAEMIAYDYDVRPNVTPGVKAFSIGPYSETRTMDQDEFGYPKSLTDQLKLRKVVQFI